MEGVLENKLGDPKLVQDLYFSIGLLDDSGSITVEITYNDAKNRSTVYTPVGVANEAAFVLPLTRKITDFVTLDKVADPFTYKIHAF